MPSAISLLLMYLLLSVPGIPLVMASDQDMTDSTPPQTPDNTPPQNPDPLVNANLDGYDLDGDHTCPKGSCI